MEAATVNSEPSALVDTKHGIVLAFGTKDLMELRFSSLRKRCRAYGIESEVDSHIRILVSSDFGVGEYEYIKARHQMPKRMKIRLGVAK